MTAHALIDDMGVDDVGFLIENLGADASELQYLRELVQNGFESIQRARRRDGQVVIDFEEVKGVRKLRITDNGTGMTPEEVRANINRISASGGVQALDRNFGIGAKITAAVRNPHGVMYKTWKGGSGSLTVLGRHDGRYGRIGFQGSDGSIDYWLPLPDAERHEIVTDSGVSVVLLGRSDEEDTTVAPPGADLPSQWASAYLERRYFEIPDGIVVRVLRPTEILDSERGERRAIYDTIRGQRYYLDKHSDARGRVDLEDAAVVWWILGSDIVRGGKTWNNRGHVAALFQGELYEVRGGHARGSALKDFGVYAGHGRIVIYVEPLDVLKATTARTNLIIRGNRPIDYARIGAAFADRMPDQLAAFMAGQVTSESGDHRRAIRKAIQEIESELGGARFRESDSGESDSFEPDDGGMTGPDLDSSLQPQPHRPPSSMDASGRLGSDYLRRAREELERRRRGQAIDADPTPVIKWVEGENSSFGGRAARYVPNQHLVTANADFEVYRDLVAWAAEEAKTRATGDIDEEALARIAEDEVRRWFEQALAEVIVVMRPLAHDVRWGAKAFDVALSDEGLTSAVVSHRWHMMSSIRRGLAGRLGSRRTEAA